MLIGDSGLIVTCEECSTSFQLDESRIPPTGARVRCSRCKHAFFLPNPSASEDQAVHSIAEDAAGDSMAGVPTASAELASPGPGPGQAGAAVPDALAPPSADPDEEDWQFSEEVRIEGDELDEDDFDPGHDFSTDGDFDDGFDEVGLAQDFSGEEPEASAPDVPEIAREVESADEDDLSIESGLELDSPSSAAAPDRDESSFGSVDDFSSLMEDEEPVAVDLAAEIASELDHEAAQADAVGMYSDGGSTDDLGDPESWDLVGGDGSGGSAASVQGVARSFGGGRAGGRSAIPDSFLDEFDSASFDDEVGEPSIIARVLPRVGGALGWVVTIALGATVFFLQVQPEWARWAQPSQSVERGALSATTTGTAWVDTSRAGTLLVVGGRVQNTGDESIWPDGIRLTFLDADGQKLVADAAQVGVPLPELVLREASHAELDAAIGTALRRFSGIPLAPGQSRDFESVVPVERLPSDARRILLEIVEPAQARAAEGAVQLGEGAVQLGEGAVQLGEGAVQLDESAGQLDEESD